MTNKIQNAIAQALKNPPGSKTYNLASQYKHWIAQSVNETERLSMINEAYRTFKRNGMIQD